MAEHPIAVDDPSPARLGPEDRAEAAGPALPDHIASWALRGPLTTALAGLCVFQLATWVPHYLTWPWFADHDVFATVARGWDAGLRPYRDVVSNNFPGQVYLFWLVGKIFGWGRTAPFYACDAALVVATGVVLLAWSRRCFGRALPGVVGFAAILTYYLGLDFSMAAQRDWQGPLLAVAGLLVLEAWPGRAGRLASAFAFAAALTIRPQVVLFLPAAATALAEKARRPGEPRGKAARAILGWAAATALLLALAFSPLILAGVWGDFVRGLRVVAYGGDYDRGGVATALRKLLLNLAGAKLWAVMAGVALLANSGGAATRRVAATWGVALLGALLYKPISPRTHGYLDHPLMLAWSVEVAVLAQLVLEARGLAPAPRLAFLAALLGAAVVVKPQYCNVADSLSAPAALLRGEAPARKPQGYHLSPPHPDPEPSYPWEDYRDVLAYLRTATRPETRVANALYGVPAITGPTGRLSAFPAESLAWLVTVKRGDPAEERAFVGALERTPDSVVVWAPREFRRDREVKLQRLEAAIRQYYEPAARFGDIEVWRRKQNADDRRPSTVGLRERHRSFGGRPTYETLFA
jgi:hypothetical protein